MNDQAVLLDRWANFYLLTSSAAATLIGLLFVVITFAAERMQPEDTAKIRLYLTPTVVYFASVLFAAALLTFPGHTWLTAALCICLVGAVGLVYSGSGFFGHDKKSYVEGGDLIPYAVFPFAAYGLLVSGGLLILHDSPRGLTIVGVGMLALLALGVRNSWFVATEVVSTRKKAALAQFIFTLS